MATRADRHLSVIRLAQDCALLGARIRTIHHITGLNPRDVQRLFFNDPQAIPRGRPPNSLEWYHGANLIARAESSIFIAIYRRLRDNGFGAGETLVSAYRGYQAICQCPHRISFDRAFDLASHTDGIWLAKAAVFEVLTCPVCGSEFLTAIGTMANAADECPFCKLIQRYHTDPRLQMSFPGCRDVNSNQTSTKTMPLSAVEPD
jgi:flagellar transcriptional activator FlhC